MATLQRGNEDPRKRVGVKQAEPVAATDVQEEMLSERIATLERFYNSREGQIVRELAQPEIERLQAELEREVRSLVETMPFECVAEYRAEIRGELSVWKRIRDSMDQLKKRLEEVRKFKEVVESKKEHMLEKFR